MEKLEKLYEKNMELYEKCVELKDFHTAAIVLHQAGEIAKTIEGGEFVKKIMEK